MNAYSEDLRKKKIVEAKERGMPTVEVARTFGVGLSSVKRYAKVVREGGSLRPKRNPGRRPKADERVRNLLEADLRKRPAATLTQRRKYLRSVARARGERVHPQQVASSYGLEQKKRQVGASERDEFLRAAWRVLVAEEIDAERLVFVDEMGSNTSLAPRGMPGRREARGRAALYRATAARTQRSWRA